jgi:hypothetical protein
MAQAYGLAAMRFYVTREEAKKESSDQSAESPASGEAKEFPVPDNLNPFVRFGRPALQGLVEQAVDEGAMIGRVGIATCGSRGVNTDVKNAVVKSLRKDMPDVYCHSEDFGY